MSALNTFFKSELVEIVTDRKNQTIRILPSDKCTDLIDVFSAWTLAPSVLDIYYAGRMVEGYEGNIIFANGEAFELVSFKDLEFKIK